MDSPPKRYRYTVGVAHTMEEKRNHAVLVGLHASSLSQEENASCFFHWGPKNDRVKYGFSSKKV